MKRLLVCLAGVFVAHYHQAAASGFDPANQREISPSFIVSKPKDVPEPLVPAVGLYQPGHVFAHPVARLDGELVRPPLLPSLVPDPVDRALLLRDYRKSGYWLTDREIDSACLRFQRVQFHGVDALRDDRLHRERATLEDYRCYVAEEVKINALLWTVYRGALTWNERAAMQKKFLAHLRRKAVIETLKA